MRGDHYAAYGASAHGEIPALLVLGRADRARQLCNEVFHWPYWGAYLTALVLSVLWNFTCNRRYTFRSTEKVARAMTLVFLYYCAFTPLSTLLEHRLADVQGWNGYLVTGLNMVLNFVTEFLYQRFVVYRNSLDTNELAHTHS